MANRCEITGKGPLSGNNVSHSMRHTKRRQLPNMQTKRIWIPEENRWVRMRISTTAIKAITRNGASAMLAKAKKRKATARKPGS
ncbi:MAG TPA: 50S ribosomal protein L28 [Abditibacteriaceae bacterium]|jgi:large subunit ribosomal protein L28